MPDFLFSPVAQMVWEMVFIFGIKVCMGTAEPFKITFFILSMQKMADFVILIISWIYGLINGLLASRIVWALQSI